MAMHEIVTGGLIQPPRARETARRKRSASWRSGVKARIEEKLTRLRREVMRLDDEIRFELSRRRPKIERVIELRERERQRSKEMQALARALRGRTDGPLPA
jgi:hypothetical protein